MPFFLSPVLNEQQFDANGDPLADGQIETYLAGTLTPVFTYKTESGTAHSNPITLDSAGYFPTGTQLWLEGGKAYKFIVKTSVVTGSVTLRTIDNITGINDSNLTPSEWQQYTTTAFTYLSPTSFSVVGDQTNIFQVNRRVQTMNTGGLAYGTVVSAVYGAPNTVVTMANTSGALDSGLSAVYYALLSATNPSVPDLYASKGLVTASGLTMATDRVLGRVSASTGAVEELTRAQLAVLSTSKVQPISASVASSALTLTLNPTTLDFRSATLGSGTTNTRTIPTAITLVISSGSTLGTTSAVLSRLAVLAIDNAGTVELAIVNLLGGVDIGEAGVISTTAEGGAGGADSASTIYSTTARANVPYRIVGYVESTQATAGTWATTPSLVNGSSSPLAMWLAGYGRTWQVVTGSRAMDTNFTNATGRPLQALVAASAAAGVSCEFTIGGVVLSRFNIAASSMNSTHSVTVQPGDVYRSNNGTLLGWSELR